jgi:hypothetical protein
LVWLKLFIRTAETFWSYRADAQPGSRPLLKEVIMNSRQIVSTLAMTAAFVASAATAEAAPVAASGYSISTFAAGPAGTSGADSVLVIGNNVYVGYSNGTPKDGSAGSSTIVEFSKSGQMLGSVSVAGHTDGLRYDAANGKIWSLQNEDANTNLVLITPGTLAKSAAIPISSVNHGGGFDDILFQGGKTFLSVSNPANNPNTDPAIVSATPGVGTVTTAPVLMGNASATLLNNGTTTTLNLQDPDSLSQTLDGRAVMTSQADGQLVFISKLGSPGQTVSVLNLNNALVDDTAFGGSAHTSLLVADKTTNAIYRITGAFNPWFGYSAAQDASAKNGFIGNLNATNSVTLSTSGGVLTPIVTGLGNPAGEAFLAPELSTWCLMMIGFGAVGFAGYRQSKKRHAVVVAA